MRVEAHWFVHLTMLYQPRVSPLLVSSMLSPKGHIGSHLFANLHSARPHVYRRFRNVPFPSAAPSPVPLLIVIQGKFIPAVTAIHMLSVSGETDLLVVVAGWNSCLIVNWCRG